jgi:hypothetical protein
MSTRLQLTLLLLLTFLSRLPFIFDGYGVEEDSWGLVVNAYEMKQTGHYVASRIPGHPLQEYVYYFVYDSPAWVYNIFSVLASMAAVLFFYLSLRKIQLQQAFAASVLFSFIPAFYIAGTYTIDFAWAMAFVLASFYFLLDRKFVLSGILLGMATGCRITSEAFLLPWALLLWSRLNTKAWLKHCLLVAVPAALIGIAWYIPAYLVYGKDFFGYSDQFPYPPFTKIAYKATIGVFGFLGMLAMLIYFFPALNRWRKNQLQAVTHFSSPRLLAACLLVIVIFIASYLRLPQKSGYMLPVVPFVIIFFATTLSRRQFFSLAAIGTASSFLFSINLTDPFRGAGSTPLAVTAKISGQEIFVDPFTGPIFSERSKRINKMNYCNSVYRQLQQMEEPAMVISGWWYNELLTENLREENKTKPKALLKFYATCATLDSARAAGMQIYYLPEQNLYNDQMFGQQCTDSLAKPFILK